VFVTRFGVAEKYGVFEIDSKVTGQYEKERMKEGVKNLSLSLVVVDKATHEIIRQMKEQENPAVFTRVKDRISLEFKIELQEDKHHQFWFMLDKGLHFFYFCDATGEIVEYSKSVLANHATNSSDSSEGSLTEMAKKLFTQMSLATTFRYNLEILTDLTNSYVHHSAEEKNTASVLGGLLCFGLLACGLLLRKLIRYYRANEKIDHPILTVLLSLCFQQIGVIFKLVHFFFYSTTGEDYQALEVVSRLWSLLADICLCLVFLLMSKGWGLVQVSVLDEYEIEFVVGCFLLCLRYIWMMLGFFLEYGSEDVYHIYDGWTGKLELLNTFVLFFWFFFSLRSCSVFTSQKFRNMADQLMVFGTIYLFLRPLLILLVYLFDPINQHIFAIAASFGSHLLICCILGYSFTNKKGVYMRISMSNGIELTGNTKIS
jgi:hypothetical protein